MSRKKKTENVVKIVGIDYGVLSFASDMENSFLLHVERNDGKRSVFILPEMSMLKVLMDSADVFVASSLIGREIEIKSSVHSGSHTDDDKPINDVIITIVK